MFNSRLDQTMRLIGGNAPKRILKFGLSWKVSKSPAGDVVSDGSGRMMGWS
jgi:hypothetical protein